MVTDRPSVEGPADAVKSRGGWRVVSESLWAVLSGVLSQQGRGRGFRNQPFPSWECSRDALSGEPVLSPGNAVSLVVESNPDLRAWKGNTPLWLAAA